MASYEISDRIEDRDRSDKEMSNKMENMDIVVKITMIMIVMEGLTKTTFLWLMGRKELNKYPKNIQNNIPIVLNNLKFDQKLKISSVTLLKKLKPNSHNIL